MIKDPVCLVLSSGYLVCLSIALLKKDLFAISFALASAVICFVKAIGGF